MVVDQSLMSLHVLNKKNIFSENYMHALSFVIFEMEIRFFLMCRTTSTSFNSNVGLLTIKAFSYI